MAYLAAFEPTAQTVFVTARAKGTLVAILPLVRETANRDGMPARWLRAPMNPHFYRVHILRDAEEAVLAPRMIWDCIASTGGWDVLSVPRFAREGFVDELTGCAVDSGFPTLLRPDIPSNYVPFPDRGAADADSPWLASVTPSLRSHLRRSYRQIVKELGGELVLERHETADPVQLARFYAIEASGWKGREGTAISCATTTLQFFNEIARAFALEHAFVLHFLRVKDVTVAGYYSLVIDGCMYPLKWAYDESYARYRPGRLLASETMRDAWERGLRIYDMGGDEGHKREWTQHLREHGTLYVFNRSLYGRLLCGYRGTWGPAVARTLKKLHRAGDAGPASAQPLTGAAGHTQNHVD
ncbi:MAG: GNAT family N-acetyltransferase [Acidobacteria bacterium]|nr:GNAT family N-acetyltransferase [Acidobacteriota bacterium]